MFVGEGSDHLQLIKFWPSRAPGKGVCGGAKIFGSDLLQPACSVCVSSERFLGATRSIEPKLLRIHTGYQKKVLATTVDGYKVQRAPRLGLCSDVGAAIDSA